MGTSSTAPFPPEGKAREGKISMPWAQPLPGPFPHHSLSQVLGAAPCSGPGRLAAAATDPESAPSPWFSYTLPTPLHTIPSLNSPQRTQLE